MTDHLFDPDEGQRRKQEGMERALGAERIIPWKEHANHALDILIASCQRFTADELTSMVGLPNISKQNQNNGVGGIIGGAAAAKRIRKVGRTTTRRQQGHAREISIWIGWDCAPGSQARQASPRPEGAPLRPNPMPQVRRGFVDAAASPPPRAPWEASR